MSKIQFKVILFIIGFFTSVEASERPIYTDRQEAAFIETYASKYNISEHYIKRTLGQAVFQEETYVLEQNHHIDTTPLENRNFRRSVRVSPVMVKAGQKFMCEHKHALKMAKNKYGIPPNYIVGIIGVETLYGRFVGNYRELDTLATLAFNSPQRTTFFQDELAEYLKMCYKNDIDPTSIISSIDGGFGLSQFMPSSYNKFAVSASNNTPNLFAPNDAIMSVANYLKKHHWKYSQKNLAAIYSYNHSVLYVLKVYQLGTRVVRRNSKYGC